MKKALWIPRVLTMIMIVIISIFSFDVFSQEAGVLQKLLAFVIHNIPSILLACILIITWKKPKTAGIAFLLYCIGFSVYFETYKSVYSIEFFTTPLLIISLLFLFIHIKTKSKG